MNKKRANFRRAAAVLHDVLAIGLCWWGAYWLRFNLDIPPHYWLRLSANMPAAVAFYMASFWVNGLYRGIWRYASLMDLRRIILAVGVVAITMASAVFMLGLEGVPRSVLVLHPLLLVLVMGGSRFLYRAWKDHLLYGHLSNDGEPVLIIGAGDAAERLVRELLRDRNWQIVGLLDDAPGRLGLDLHGVKILGPVETLPQWAEKFQVSKVVVAMPAATVSARRHAMEFAVQCGMTTLTIPDTKELLSGRMSISQFRRVELEDLLGREPVSLDSAELNCWLSGKVALVTGAGGSIGSELCRQVASISPACLVLYELSEFALYRIEQELAAAFPLLPLVPLVGDVKDTLRLEQVFAAHQPEVVFHAAAYKHVPLMEDDNAWEAVRNNALGSWRVARAAQRHGAGHFVLISTDKAVNPTNVMGATKRLAERMVLQLQREEGTRFVMVRFGNVLGSSGSVIPKFREQIAKGGPVTVTHPEIIRYFMLIPEAVQLVLQAGLMGQGGEIFVLDMGEPVKIVDLARDMIRLSGFSESEIRVEFTGLRPGEKLYEELLADGEQTVPTPHPKLRVARARERHDENWLGELLKWLDSAECPPDLVKLQLQRFVPEYQPQSVTAISHKSSLLPIS